VRQPHKWLAGPASDITVKDRIHTWSSCLTTSVAALKSPAAMIVGLIAVWLRRHSGQHAGGRQAEQGADDPAAPVRGVAVLEGQHPLEGPLLPCACCADTLPYMLACMLLSGWHDRVYASCCAVFAEYCYIRLR